MPSAIVSTFYRSQVDELVRIIESYAPRITYGRVRRGWWARPFHDHFEYEVAGEEPYLSKLLEEVAEWEEEQRNRLAW